MDYFNPQAVRPQQSFEPPAGLAGMMYMRDRQMYDQLTPLQKQMMEIEARRKAAEFQDYNLDAPVRQAKRGADISKSGLDEMLNTTRRTTQGYGDAIAGGEMGAAQSTQAQGMFDMGTVGSRMDAANVGNQNKTEEGVLDMFYRSAPRLKTAAQASPVAAEMEYKRFISGLPQNIRAKLPPSYSPQVQQLLDGMLEQHVNNPTQRRASALQKQQDEEAYRRTDRSARATEFAATQRASASSRSLLTQFNRSTTPETIDALGTALLADRENLDPRDVIKIEAGVQQARRILAMKAGKGQLNMDNPTGSPSSVADDLNKFLGGGGQPQQGQPGVDRPFTMNELRKLYPGKSDQILRDAHKKRFGKDPL
jgi:hypothetical protein